jgi:CheY-like chemotaxis protein
MSCRILVIEDDLSIQEFMQMLLDDEGYAVAVASNGLEALDVLKAFQPNLIFLDIAMPVMDGWTFLKTYHNVLAVPIIALSATANFSLPDKWVGLSGFLAKPFNIDDLLDCVVTHLKTGVS